MSPHAQGEEDRHERRLAKLGTSVVAPTLDAFPKNTLVPWNLHCRHFGSLLAYQNPGQDWLSCPAVFQALGASLSCQQGRCVALPPHLHFAGRWTCLVPLLVSLCTAEELSGATPQQWRSVPVDREGTHSDFPLLCLWRPIAAQLTCVQGSQVRGKGCGYGILF